MQSPEETRRKSRERSAKRREKNRALPDADKTPRTTEKACAACKEVKPTTPEFFVRARCESSGLSPYCKPCTAARSRTRDKVAIAARQRELRKANREQYNERIRQKRRENPEHFRAKGREYQKRWKRKNPWNRARHAMSTCVTRSIRTGKYDSWQTIVGYTLADLKTHLESLFEPGMSWGNYGKHGWHIGHRRPVSWFNFETAQDPDFAACWALSNLFPQWAHENQSAGNRKSFEPPPPGHQLPSQGGPSVLGCVGQSPPEACS